MGYQVGDPEYRRILVALFMAGFATFAQLYSAQALMPLISTSLEITADTAGLSISMATGGLGASVLIWASLADRYGRTAVMKSSAVLAAIIGLAIPFLPTWNAILTFRLFEGMALGALPALAMAYLGEEIHPRYLAIVAGTYVSGNTIGGLSGRILGGLVGDWVGWRGGLFVVSCACALAAVAFLIVTPKPRGFVPTSRRTNPGPSVASRLAESLSIPKLWAVYGTGFLGMGAFVSMYSYLGYELNDEFGLPTAVTSLIFVVYLVGTVASRFAGKLAFLWGSRRVISGGFALMCLGGSLTLVPLLPVVLIGLVVFTYGFFSVNPIASALTARLTRHARAQASAFYQLCYYAGSALIGWLVGVLLVYSGWTTAVLGILVSSFVGLVIAYVFLRNLPHSAATSQIPTIHPPIH